MKLYASFIIKRWLSFALLLLLCTFAKFGYAEKLALTQPQEATCPPLFVADKDPSRIGQCKLESPPNDKPKCDSYGSLLKWDGSCVVSKPPVQASCLTIAGYTSSFVVKDDKVICEYDRPVVPSTNSGDFIGDCFTLKSPLAGNPAGTRLFVTDQDNSTATNPKLVLVPASDWSHKKWPLELLQDFLPGYLSCHAATSQTLPVKLDASDLAQSGATRRGYSYGVLTMPYKYYPGSKKFVSGIPIGGYLGWRTGQPGSAMTFALAATLSSVSADTINVAVDGSKTVSGTTNAMALSWAAGWTFDVTRRPAGKAFRSGIFVGRDHVNTSENLRYEHNNKTWVALQIGFDFTDY